MYVHRATRVILEEEVKDTKKVDDKEGEEEGEKTYDPMEGDVFDSDEMQNRRCAERRAFAPIHALFLAR